MANEHRQTATCMGRAHNARHPRAADQPFPAADSWRPPAQPAGPRRGRNGDDRRHLEGTARVRLRAQRALRGCRRQHPSIPGTGTAAGSARPEAWTTHDGPFEGRRRRHRQANVWPRPWQQPHPSVTTGSAVGARGPARACRRGLSAVYSRVRPIFDAYRANRLKHHGGRAPPDRLAYCALTHAGEAEDGANRLVHAGQQGLGALEEPFRLPSAEARRQRRAHASGTGAAYSTDLRERMRRGNVFAGTPGQAYRQGVPGASRRFRPHDRASWPPFGRKSLADAPRARGVSAPPRTRGCLESRGGGGKAQAAARSCRRPRRRFRALNFREIRR